MSELVEILKQMRFQGDMGKGYRRVMAQGNGGALSMRIVQVALITFTLFIVIPTLYSRFSRSSPKPAYLPLLRFANL